MATIANFQYVRPPIPKAATVDEKKFYQGLFDVFDQIFSAYGRIGNTMLDKGVVSTISGKVDGAYVESAISQMAGELTLMVGDKASITIALTEPVDPETGDLWMHTTTKVVQIYNGTAWEPTAVAEVNASFVKITQNLIQILSGGSIDIQAGSHFNIRAGSGASAIGISNDEANSYMIWAGASDPAAAPFYVKRTGAIKATMLTLGNSQITDVTNTYAQHFVENADSTYPAVFSIYIPENTGSVAAVKLAFKASKYRAYSKSAASGGGATSGAAGVLQTGNTALTTGGSSTASTSGASATYTGDSMGDGMHNHSMSHTHPHNHTHDIDNHNHTVPDHTHSTPNHSHGLVYGIYEKATLPTSCSLYVDGTLVATYTNTPPSVSELDVSSYLTKSGGILVKGWHEIKITTNDDARITANVFVQTVVSSVTGVM